MAGARGDEQTGEDQASLTNSICYYAFHLSDATQEEQLESGGVRHTQTSAEKNAPLVAATRRSEGAPEMEPPVAVEDDDMKVDGTKVSITPRVHFVTAAL